MLEARASPWERMAKRLHMWHRSWHEPSSFKVFEHALASQEPRARSGSRSRKAGTESRNLASVSLTPLPGFPSGFVGQHSISVS